MHLRPRGLFLFQSEYPIAAEATIPEGHYALHRGIPYYSARACLASVGDPRDYADCLEDA